MPKIAEEPYQDEPMFDDMEISRRSISLNKTEDQTNENNVVKRISAKHKGK